MTLPDSFIDELKYKNNIADVISSYVNLKRAGRNMVGLCPFHNEKTPSFNVYSENGSFYCFGCGVGGDVITFIRLIENLDYIDSVKFLAKRAGLAVPENNYDDKVSKLKVRIYEANREAAKFYHKMLYSQQGLEALSYLRKRGLTEHTIKHFGLGYSPKSRFSLVNYLSKLGFKNEELVAANLAFNGRNNTAIDRFSDRVMFPIIDQRGNVIAFGGRILTDAKPKYLNTSDTVVFRKSANLFAFNFAKNVNKNRLILAEGYMDVIALNQAGFENTVATLGTSLTFEQSKLIARYAEEVIVAYDSDEAGRKATNRAIPMLRGAGLNVKVLTIPKGKDPDEFIRSFGDQGPVRFKQLLEKSENDVLYSLSKVKKLVNLETSEGKIAYLKEAIKILSMVENRLEREVYATKLSEEVKIEKSSIISQVNKYIKNRINSESKKQVIEMQKTLSAQKDKVNPEKENNLRAANAEEALIALIINNPQLVNNIASKLSASKFCTSFNKRVYEEIIKRANEGKSIELTDLSQKFSIEEMGRIAKILSSYIQSEDTLSLANDYIDVIINENAKLKINKETAQEDDIKDYINKLRKLKK